MRAFIIPAVAAGLAIALSAVPAQAGKRDNTLKFAADQVPENIDA